MMLPELKGRPSELIKNSSDALKKDKVYGNSNLKTKARTRIETKLAKMNSFILSEG